MVQSLIELGSKENGYLGDTGVGTDLTLLGFQPSQWRRDRFSSWY